jgi:MraZ protein
MLGGEETYSMDNKGRVSIPLNIRKALAASTEPNETFTVIRGMNGCINAYPQSKWKKYQERIDKLNLFDEKNLLFLRAFLRWKQELTLDEQNRIILPKNLIEHAKIQNKVLVIGVNDHIEFWNPELFENYMNELEKEIPYEKVAAMVMTDKNID